MVEMECFPWCHGIFVQCTRIRGLSNQLLGRSYFRIECFQHDIHVKVHGLSNCAISFHLFQVSVSLILESIQDNQKVVISFIHWKHEGSQAGQNLAFLPIQSQRVQDSCAAKVPQFLFLRIEQEELVSLGCYVGFNLSFLEAVACSSSRVCFPFF